MQQNKIYNIADEETQLVYLQLLEYTSLWYPFKTLTSKRQIISFLYNNNTIIIPEMYSFIIPLINKVEDSARNTILDSSGIIFIEMFINYYQDGNYSTPMHRHQCRQITMSLGAKRTLKVNTKDVEMNHGDIIFLHQEKHGVLKDSSTEPRISFNLFFTTTSENEFKVNY
jgi:hypothetical protein